MGWTTSLLLLSLLGLSACQQRSLSDGGRRRQRLQPTKPEVVNFNCPQDFGYYPHPTDCTQYYVCVFGGALQESCTGGLVYSHELETCDWPRNVDCNGATGGGVSTIIVTDPRTANTRQISAVTEALTPSVGFGKFDHSFSSTKSHRTTQSLNGGADRGGNERALFRQPSSSKSQFLTPHFSSAASSFFSAPQGTSNSRRPAKSATYTPTWQQSLVRVTREAPSTSIRRRDLTLLDASRDSDLGLSSLKRHDTLTASSSARHPWRVAARSPTTSGQSDPRPYSPPKHHHGITRRQSPFPQQGLIPKHFQTPQHSRFSRKPSTKPLHSSQTSTFQRQSFQSNPFGVLQSFKPFGSSFDTRPFTANGREQAHRRPPPQQQLRPHHKQRPRPHPDPFHHRPLSQFPPVRSHLSFPTSKPQTDNFAFTSYGGPYGDSYNTRPDSEPFLPEEAKAKPQPDDTAYQPPLDEEYLLPQPLHTVHPTSRPPHVPHHPTYSPHPPPLNPHQFPPTHPPSSHPHFFPHVPETKYPPRFNIKITTTPPPQRPAATTPPPAYNTHPTTSRPQPTPSRPKYTTSKPRPTSYPTPPPVYKPRPTPYRPKHTTSKPRPTSYPTPPPVYKPHSRPVSRPRSTTTTTTQPRPRSTTPRTTTFPPLSTTPRPRHIATHSPRPFLNSIETLEEYEDEIASFDTPQIKPETATPYTTKRFTFPTFAKARGTTTNPFGVKGGKRTSSLAPPPQIPGTVHHPELSRLPASSLKTSDSPKTSPKLTQDNAKPSRPVVNHGPAAPSRLPSVDQTYFSDFNFTDPDYYYYYDDLLYDYYDVAPAPTQAPARRPAPTQPARTPTRSSSKSGSRSSSSSSNTRASPSQSGPPAVDNSQPKRSRRPTLKPVSVLAPSVSVAIDIWRYPARRPTPTRAQPTPDTKATKCDPKVCRIPDCNCGGKDIPGGLSPVEVPQLVLLTFDDAVNDLNKGLYSDLFKAGRKNPNGCPIASTMYVSHEWTDYSQVQNLYAEGHEIASHSVSHSFGEQFSTSKWAKEISGQREILSAYGGVKMEDVRGMRAPFLAVGGNKMFRMLYEQNFTYDSSMPVYENTPPSWPYTLDYRLFHDCMIPPCPTNSYPGLWQVPMVMWQDLKGGRCSMGDACTTPPDAEGVYKMLIKNFERHYTSNRAPFGLFYHAAWFTTPHHKEGFIAFLDTITAMDDVWLTTNWQALQYVRDPTPLSQVKNFAPFQCNYSDRPRCTSKRVCNVWHKGGVRYMRTCQKCPEEYPWTGNTGVKSPLNDLP